METSAPIERAGSAPDLLQLDTHSLRRACSPSSSSGSGSGSEEDSPQTPLPSSSRIYADGLPTPDPTPSPPANQTAVEAEEFFQADALTPQQQQPEPSLSQKEHAESPTLSVVSDSDGLTPPSLRHPQPLGTGRRRGRPTLPFSLWELLREEVRAQDPSDASHEGKSERVSNFLKVPMRVEKMVVFGYAICFDAFLYNFTILPLRCGVAAYALVKSTCGAVVEQRPRTRLRFTQKCDLTKGILVLLATLILQRVTDASRMYHSVRGQETIKLYVIFNVLEIADRLCCSLGQDLQDSLLSRSALGRRVDGTHPHIRPALLLALNLAYILAHTTVLFYQLVTLNVAINSYSNALLTLLMSNQFVEIKGAVFKKFEKENVFQMSCADIVERFQMSLLLTIIALRNLFEVSGSMFSTLPTSYINISVLPSFSVFHRIFTPAIIVLISEMLVDWLKHAFICKFNHIRPAIYGRFVDVLSRDLIHPATTSASSQPLVDQSSAVSRRLGFASIPLACLVVRVFCQILDMLSDDSGIDECAPTEAQPAGAVVGRGWLALGMRMFQSDWLALVTRWSVLALAGLVVWGAMVVIKLLVGIRLQEYALSRLDGMEERQDEDRLNARNRVPLGLSPEEKLDESNTREFLSSPSLDASSKRPVKLEVNPDSKTLTLDNLGRFDIVKSRLY